MAEYEETPLPKNVWREKSRTSNLKARGQSLTNTWRDNCGHAANQRTESTTLDLHAKQEMRRP